MNKSIVLFLVFNLFFFNCKKENISWDVDVKNIETHEKIINFPEAFYDTSVPFETIKKQYSIFLNSSVPDEIAIKQRTDTTEVQIYSEIKKNIDTKKLASEIHLLFQHIKYYYPSFKEPNIYLFSSVFNEEYQAEPIIYDPNEAKLFIALDFFIGEENEWLKALKIPAYLRKNMNSENIVPRISMKIAEHIVPFNLSKKHFLNFVIFYGKTMLLQDAFLPSYSDELKIGYTKNDIEWSAKNEKNVWNYFLENEYLFSDDADLNRRFIYTAPFSKFYINNEENKSVDAESPGKIGVWLGWQILRKYNAENQQDGLIKIVLNPDYQEILNQSGYQP